MTKLGDRTLKKCVCDKRGDTIFLAYKNDDEQVITGYFILLEDLNKQTTFLKVKSGSNILMIPHNRILKIKIKEDQDD